MNAAAAVYVEIVEYESGKVIKRTGPMAERRAGKLDRGYNINLNHKQFYTRIVNESKGVRDGSE